MIKKTKVKLLSLILVLLMLISMMPVSFVSAATAYDVETGDEAQVQSEVITDVNTKEATNTNSEITMLSDEGEAYTLPYQIIDGLYAYAGTEVKGTNAWQRWDKVNGQRHFYLAPSVSDTEVIILNTYSAEVTLNGVTIPAGEYRTVPYVDGESYTCSGATTQSVLIQKTDAEGTIFINSAEGMVTVNDDSAQTETTINDPSYDVYSFLTGNTKHREAQNLDGAVASAENGVMDDTVIKKMKGRGNTTWDLEKKPFNITYKSNIQIDNMTGKKWSLLANAQDSSLLRNRLMYDLSNEVGMKYACDSRFVDMFVNGDYKGSYQLTQKIEMGSNTVMHDLKEPIVEVEEEGDVVPTENFDFVLELDMAEKAASAGDMTFLSGRGQVMTHKIPDEPTSEQIAFMKQKYQEFEDALYNDDMAALEKIIDINDLAKAYLINEIAMNLDGALTSCYFVYNSAKGIFYASPVWDYDNGVGNTVGLSDRKDINGNVLYNTKPEGWYTREMLHIDSGFDPQGDGRTVFSQACYMESKTSDNKTFMEIVKEIWASDFADAADILTGNAQATGRLQTLDSYTSKILKSGQWNYSNAGWDLNNNTNNSWIADHSTLTYYTYNSENNALSKETRTYNQKTFSGQADYACDWLISRLNWLNAEFTDAEPAAGYITVYFAVSGWNKAYLYGFYGEEGSEPESEWPSSYPGEEMTFLEVDENSDSVYSCKVPADIDFIKFSDGTSDNKRTNNVSNSMLFDGAAFCLGSSAGTNKWDVVSYDYTPPAEDNDATDDEVTPEPEIKESNFALRGTFTSWDDVTALKFIDGSDIVVEAVYTLEAGEYKFKFYDMSAQKWYGSDSTISNTTSSALTMKTGTGNCTITVNGGTYVFRFDTSSKKLTVTEESTTFTVTFKDHDGTELSVQTVSKGEDATAPQTPERAATAQYTYTFKEWDTDFTNITADTVVTAVYNQTINKYTVTFVDWDNTELSVQTVEYGSGASEPDAPTREGYNFTGWDKDFTNITADTVVTAKYTKIPVAPTTGRLAVDVAGGAGFTISVNGGAARPQGATYMNTKMPIGATVTVTAIATDGIEFIGWIAPDNGKILSTDLTYTFTATGNDFVKATFATKVEGVQLVKFVNDKSGQILEMQYYASTETIEFPNAPFQVGFDFAGWDMTEAEIQAAIAAGQDVTVTAVWTRQIVYVNVTVIGGTGGGKVLANNACTVTANAPEAGMKFAYWADGDGNIKSYQTSYKIFPASDITLEAVFVAEDAVVEQKVLISLDAIDTTSATTVNTFYYSWSLPEGCTVVQGGIIAVNKASYNEATFYANSTDSNVYTRPKSSKTDLVYAGSWNKSDVAAGDTWIAQAFIIYKDANGETHTVYSQIVEATKE